MERRTDDVMTDVERLTVTHTVSLSDSQSREANWRSAEVARAPISLLVSFDRDRAQRHAVWLMLRGPS